jgi:hypothetical protein
MYVVLVTDTEKNIEWVRKMTSAKALLRTGVNYSTTTRHGFTTHVTWVYIESPIPHAELISQFKNLHENRVGYKVKILKPVVLRGPVRTWDEALQLAYEALVRYKPPVKRIQVRTRGHGCGCSRELFKNLRKLAWDMGFRTTSHSGRRYILEVMAWPRWKVGGLPVVTVGLYPHDLVVNLF